MKKYQLMAPGPTPVPSEVLLAMARPMIHHRTPEYAALFDEVRAGLKRLVQTRQDVLTPACTGTGAMEAAVANTLSAGDRVIVVNAGAFAQRWMAIAVLVSASQKGRMLPPGLGIVALSDKAWSMAARSSSPKFYLDLAEERKYASKNEARFTPAVSIMVGLREVLRMIEAEGLANVFRRHDRLSRATRAGAEALGLRLFVKATPSPALTAIEVPAGVDADRVVEGFATSHNITIDGGRGPTKGKIFRIGHMGYAAETDVIIALAALEQVLADLCQPLDFGASVRAAQKVFAEKP